MMGRPVPAPTTTATAAHRAGTRAAPCGPSHLMHLTRLTARGVIRVVRLVPAAPVPLVTPGAATRVPMGLQVPTPPATPVRVSPTAPGPIHALCQPLAALLEPWSGALPGPAAGLGPVLGLTSLAVLDQPFLRPRACIPRPALTLAPGPGPGPGHACTTAPRRGPANPGLHL